MKMGFFGVVFEKSLEIAFGSMEHNKKVLKDRFGTVSSKERSFLFDKDILSDRMQRRETCEAKKVNFVDHLWYLGAHGFAVLREQNRTKLWKKQRRLVSLKNNPENIYIYSMSFYVHPIFFQQCS